MGKRFDLTGRRFGRLTVLHRDPEDYLPLSGVSCPRWVCRCECGETVTVVARSLLYGRTRSCGCLRRENAGRRAKGLPLRKEDEPIKRYCKRFYCDALGDRVCCAACRYRADCGNPCLNHPSRCGLEDTERAATPQPAKPAAPLAGEPKGGGPHPALRATFPVRGEGRERGTPQPAKPAAPLAGEPKGDDGK